MSREFLRRHPLWIGFLPIFIPLLVLLALQYWWLVELEKTSAIADKATLSSYREAVVTEVLYTYGGGAERTLAIPAPFVSGNRLDAIADQFRSRLFEGARAHFLVRFNGDDEQLLFYNPALYRLEPIDPCDMTRAVTVAAAPWKLLNSKGIEVDAARLTVEERDPENRIILYPIVDGASRVVGVAGLVIDTDWFERHLLPGVIRNSLGRFFTDAARANVIVTVRDGSGKTVWTNQTGGDAIAPDDVTGPFSLVFNDWRIGIHNRDQSPEQWARANFGFNIALSIATALVLTIGIVLAMRTVSREMKLSQMKADFVSNVSHELRTPLASIRIYGEFLKMGRVSDPGKVREYGHYIESESRRLTQLINNILDFAKIESGQKAYEFRRADPGVVIEETLRNFEMRLVDSGFEVFYEGAVRPLPEISMDPDAVSQAILNLLDNAVKYSGEGRRVFVRLERDQDTAVISVRDEGIGISPDEQKKVFDRFHRVGTGLVHDVKGSGLGLAIVNHIAAAHGGSVELSSEPGRGSTFSIRLPIGIKGSRELSGLAAV